MSTVGFSVGVLLALGLLAREIRRTLGSDRRGALAKNLDGSLLALAGVFAVVVFLQVSSYLH
jgi:hypothetical protein